MVAHCSVPGRAVNANKSVEVSQDHKLVRVRSGLDESLKLFIELLFALICVS